MSSPLTQSVSTSETALYEPKYNGSNGPAASGGPTVVDTEKSAQAPHEAVEQPQETRTVRGWRWLMICFAVYSSCFLYGLDNTIVADIQASVVDTFGEIEKLSWLGIGFPLGSIATILSLGKSFGIFDVKWLYVASLVMFTAGSALCGGAPNLDALIVGRVWAGVGGAGMYLGLLNIIALTTTIRERPMYMGLTGLCWGVGCILGPVVGGSFADSSATWRWAFYINLVILGLFSPVYLFLLDSYQPRPGVPFLQKLKYLDWVGIVLNAAVYVTFVMILTYGGATWAWDDGRMITLYVMFAVTLIAFVITQYTVAFTTKENRIFPGDFLRRRSLVLLYVCCSCAGAGLVIPIYYIPLYFQFAQGDSGIEAAVRLLPFICLNIFFCVFNGIAMPLWGYYQPWFLASGVFLTAGGALMYTVNSSTSTSAIYGYSILIGIGAGLSQQAAYSVAPAKVAPNRVPDAVSFINTSQIGAIVIALTVSGSVFQNVAYSNLQQSLSGLGFAPEQIRASLAGVRSTVFETVPEDVRASAIEGIVSAVGDTYTLVIAAGALMLISAAFLRREKLFMEVAAGA